MKILEKITESVIFKNLVSKINDLVDNSNETSSRLDGISSDLGNLADATPLVAPNVAGMTDTTKLYVNTSDGYVYWYTNNQWTSTGILYTGDVSETVARVGELEEETDLLKETLANGTIRGVLSGEFSLSDILEAGYYLISDTSTISDLPAGINFTPSYIVVSKFVDDYEWTKQTIGSVTLTCNEYSRTYSVNTGFNDWVMNNPCYISTSGDCTTQIVEVLENHGYIELGAGDFYINNLTMPNNTMIRGQGKSTRLIVHDYHTHGIIMTKGCSIENVEIVGMANTYTDIKGDSAGIYITGEDIYNIKIHNCVIHGFNLGGIYVVNTGYWCACSVTASNCEIYHCYAGIYCDVSAEYSRFTNIICRDNNKGCENNGGNNVFANCTFSNNTVGFQIYADENTVNNGHGSCVGCTFNHSGNNQGYAIIANGISNGFVFSACQIWYGKIFIEQSKGIVFDGCEMGGSITFLINWLTGILLIANCLFNVLPTKTFANDGSKTYTIFNSCYMFDGTAITIS